MSDPSLSAGDQVADVSRRSWAQLKTLHPVTRLAIAAGLIHMVGELLTALSLVMRNINAGYSWAGIPLESLAGVLTSFGYSLSFFATAATVEFLFRIWREVVLIRQARDAERRA